MPPFSSLSDELLCHISLLVDPSSLLNLALTNKRLLRCSHRSLQRGWELWCVKRHLDDRKPLTVPSALLDIIHDPPLAWYTRSLEVWVLRQGWHHWKGWNLDEQPHDEFDSGSEDEQSTAINRPHDYTHLDSTFYSGSEYAQISKLLKDVLRVHPISLSQSERKLRLGYDESLKALLFALCPKLATLTFKMPDIGDQVDATQSYPLTLLSRSIEALTLGKVPHGQWPVGFQSLRAIVVGKFTRYHPPYALYHPCKAVAPLLLLPNLKRLDLNLRIDHVVEDSNVYIFEWGRKVSSVEDLQLNFGGLGDATIRSFMQACKALRVFQTSPGLDLRLRAGILDALMEHTASLKGLGLVEYPGHWARMLDSRLIQFESLSNLSIQSCHLKNDRVTDKTHRSSGAAIFRNNAASETEGSPLVEGHLIDLHRYLPQSLEKLIIHNTGAFLFKRAAEFVQLLIRLVDDNYCADLKHPQLREIRIFAPLFYARADIDTASCDRLQSLCEERGVALHGFNHGQAFF